MPKQEVGMEWLRRRMEELNYKTLDEVATRIGIHRGNLWRYFYFENIPRMELLPKMCNVLFCTPTELLRALKLLGHNETL